MTSFAAERPAIESRFATQFIAAPISFDNVADSAAVTAAKQAGSPWVRLAIINGESRTAGVAGDGDIRIEHQGQIVVQVFVRDGTGTATARSLADAAAAVFRHARFDGIACFSPSMQIVGNDGFGCYQINVSTPYRRFTN